MNYWRIALLAIVFTGLVAGCANPVLVTPVATETTDNTTTASTTPDSTAPDSTATATPSAYRELMDSEIRGIDPDTISGYLAGEGLGMALPAELNGYPGPRHALDLRDELALTPEQTDQIQALFDAMQPQAIELGQAYLDAEAKLESEFRNGTIDEEGLRSQLQQSAGVLADLRFVHLQTHLATVEILSPQQIQQYNMLRGYAEMPAGHEHQEHP